LGRRSNRRSAIAANVVVVGVEPMQTLALQTYPELQVPQLSVPPHPSEIEPQFLFWAAQVVGAQTDAPDELKPISSR
jgi:hypothetical protein